MKTRITLDLVKGLLLHEIVTFPWSNLPVFYLLHGRLFGWSKKGKALLSRSLILYGTAIKIFFIELGVAAYHRNLVPAYKDLFDMSSRLKGIAV